MQIWLLKPSEQMGQDRLFPYQELENCWHRCAKTSEHQLGEALIQYLPHPTQINAGRESDPERRAGWAIVTSGEFACFSSRPNADRVSWIHAATKAYAEKAFAASEVASAPPEVFVTADLVSKGKPDPEPYLKGAELTKSDITKCVVFEDAPPGVLSGKRAGAKVVGLRTTHEGAKQWQNGADFVVEDLRKISARWEGKGKSAKLFLTIDSESKPEHIGTNGTAAH